MKATTPEPTPSLAVLAWSLSGLVAVLALIAWGSSFQWNFSNFSSYQLFPVFGLLAFSIMWSHYVVALLKRLYSPNSTLKTFFQWTGYAVLLLIVAHPGLLAYQRFRDGFGLPPHSETSYVAPGMAWIVTLGISSLLIFLAYELRRWFGKKPWWKFVVYAGDAAMLAIFYHGLRLGSQTGGGWFHIVWLFYGLSLILVLGYNYAGKIWHLPGTRQV